LTLPLEGVRVVEYAQYVAGPLCGVLLADLGADVVKVEPPAGDGYRHVMPIAPDVGRYFVPLNRGKRSVVVDLKTAEGLEASSRLLRSADMVLHNFPRERAARFGLDWESVHETHAALVVGRVSAFGETGPLADAPAYDLVAQARAGLLTAHASRGDVVPVRAGGIPIADLAAGFLLATGVLAALLRARQTGEGDLVDVSLFAAALAVQLQDLVWLEGEATAARLTDRAELAARADDIAGDVAMNPYYRCFETAEGFVAVACLNLGQRRAFLALFGLDDPTIEAPDVAPEDEPALAAKTDLTAAIARAFAEQTASTWLERLESAGVPCARVQQREGVSADPQVVAEALVGRITQPGLGEIDLLAPFVRAGGRRPAQRAAPELGADTEAVLAELT
jgi:crotonobetainyl-CoA:carnitine CoA-transferase CaiB-like acyl-CoA transferase